MARAARKGNYLEDLRKARWYLDREIQRVTGLRTASGRSQPQEATFVSASPAVDLNVVVQTTPACLRDRPQWVAWKYIERDGKPTKAPVNPLTGGLADSTDPSTWATFQQAVAACQQRPGLAGVGFVFTPDDPYCGVDLDDCIDPETGQIKAWAADVHRQLGQLHRDQPVRHGRQGIPEGQQARQPLPQGIRGRRGRNLRPGPVLHGDRPTAAPTRRPTSNCVRNSWTPSTAQSSATMVAVTTGRRQRYRRTRSPATTARSHLDDDQIIDLASSQRRSGAKFATLWAGDWNAYFNSASEADSSVVFTLAFYTKDAAQIDRLFRRSGLMRAKWDELHGEQTYGATTIAKALAKVTKQYPPKSGKRKSKPSASPAASRIPASRPSSSTTRSSAT